ncbi:hypothetical protein BGX28_006395 [Mortierella sp. GBA30]|nr:hypothetical protein BGX28_006395 [Mortierella sp. GBA30]
MSGSAPSVKDLYKVVTADLAAFVIGEKAKEQDTIHVYLERFIKANSAAQASTPLTPSSTGAHTSGATPGFGGISSAGQGAVGVAVGSSNTTAPSLSASMGAGSSLSSTAAGQRHANELWYQSLTNNAILQHSGDLPFAFHRVGKTPSATNSPNSSGPTSQNTSLSGSPVISGGPAATAQPSIAVANASSGSGQATPTAAAASPAIPSSSTTYTISSLPANTPLAAQRFSAHLVTLFTQHGMGAAPIASVASRMIVYLTHLLPFLTPQLVVSDWWDRLIEPSLQGEIKLDKESLKACRDLVTECMARDNLMDAVGSGTGSLLVAGDEEGQLDTHVAMAAMPIPQFVLRKYIKAAHKLNHRLEDPELTGLQYHADESGGPWLQPKDSALSSGHAGHDAGSGLPFARSASSISNSLISEYPPVLQDLETQQRLLSRARAIIRRKKDLLVKNLELILFAYGGAVGRVKDFFSCLYTYFVGARFRPEILGLLCQFIRRQILATPLFDSLLLSLKYDTSPLVVSLGLMTLIMLMPRIPAALNDKLPDLFLILSRILCWPKSQQQLLTVTNQEGANLTGQTIKSFDEFDDEAISTDHTAKNGGNSSNRDSKAAESEESSDGVESEDIPLYSHGIRWRRYGPAMPGGRKEGAPDPTAIFSFLYGLFPCNLLKFLHSPRLYISQTLSPTGSPKQGSGTGSSTIEADSATNNSVDGVSYSAREGASGDSKVYIDEDLLKSRVQTMLKRHSLHPDLLTLTCEQELVNKARWQKLEPMEIVAMCVGLDVWSAGGLYGTGPVLRSIEEDKGDVPTQDSDEEDEEGEIDHSASSDHTQTVAEKAARSSPVQSQASASVESLGSEASEGTPIEILAQEEFFGPRAVHDRISQSRALPDTTLSAFHRGQQRQPIPGKSSPPRTRKRSKEVRMSQILQNFATLRGLDHDEYLAETASSSSLGLGLNPDLIVRERKGSVLRNSVSSGSITAAVATSTSADPAPVTSGSVVDIPTEESMALTITSPGTTQDSPQHPTTMATLILLNQEYRRVVKHLEHDLLVAKNELNFELFLKQQHIQQISKVHRAHVLDASVEAERQNLYNTCRSLKAQLHETRLLLEKEKSELEKRKNKQTHWDTELKNKLQMFRDERKQLQFEVERLKQDINDTRQAQEIQERLLTEERKGTFQLKNTIEDLSPKLKRMEEYEKRIEEMTRQLVLWETEQNKALEMQRQLESVVSRWKKVEQLLAAEREECRMLRNRVSQQSQILDDMRIQMTMSEGRGPDAMADTPPMEYQSEEGEENGVEPEGGEGVEEQQGHREGDDEKIAENEREDQSLSVHRKTSNSLRHRNSASALDTNNWPSTFSRSSSSQTGYDHQQKADAMQEFLIREKERWDQELQQAHNRWSREAMRNQELEDRILELQGQLETARAIDMRQQTSGSHRGDHSHTTGPHGASGSGMPLIHVPSKPQNVPFATVTTDTTSGIGTHDDSTEGGDTDDGGIGSGRSIGRYSRQRPETEDEDDLVAQRMRFINRSAADLPPQPAQSGSSRSKGKGTKSSKSKWPAILERAQTDRGTYTTSTHLGSHAPGLLDLSRHPPSQQSHSSQQPTRKSGESSSTRTTASSNSVAAARAASGGLVPHMEYSRKMSTISDGASSDVTTASDSSAATGGQTGEESQSGGKKGAKSKSKKEEEKERVRLMTGMGPLVDPSKMYRNVRMF